MYTVHYITVGMMERKQIMEAANAQEVEDTILSVHGDKTVILSIIKL
jgi:hypothetical protein